MLDEPAAIPAMIASVKTRFLIKSLSV